MSRCDFKIVLLGSEHVGKTSLVLRFVNCSFNSGRVYQNTIGAAFCAKAMHSNGKDCNIGIWDTAGSERYEAMTRMYYRGAHAAIICYDPCCAESWTRLRHWLAELRTVEEDCKVYLCGTKKDILDSGAERKVPEDIIATYSQGLQAHYLTSSKTGENVVSMETNLTFPWRLSLQFYIILMETRFFVLLLSQELFQKIVDDCMSDRELMRNVEEARVRLQKEQNVDKKRNCLC